MLVLLIEEPAKLDEFTEADMRRWWRHHCKRHVANGELFFELGPPVRVNAREGVKRLGSFGVRARIARRQV